MGAGDGAVAMASATGRTWRCSGGTGTVIRADTVRAYAAETGFRGIHELPIEHEFWRFYHLNP